MAARSQRKAAQHHWKQFELSDPPAEPGIYAIKAGERWLYIGRSVDVRTRVSKKTHPAQITRGLATLPLTYWWFRLEAENQRRAEHTLIRQHEPEWNGFTAWAGRTSYPHCEPANVLAVTYRAEIAAALEAA
jgi:excinuclease UvrABC nuclease subunit